MLQQSHPLPPPMMPLPSLHSTKHSILPFKKKQIILNISLKNVTSSLYKELYEDTTSVATAGNIIPFSPPSPLAPQQTPLPPCLPRQSPNNQLPHIPTPNKNQHFSLTHFFSHLFL